MIVRLTNSWNSIFSEEHREFLKNNSHRYDEEDEYLSDKERSKGVTPRKRSVFELIAHIDLIPIDLLNHKSVEIQFLKGLVSLVDKAIGANMGETKLLNAQATNIHLPSNELFQVSSTLLLEDACTDELQKSLDKGWRIIACIPRPGQRRPDYI